MLPRSQSAASCRSIPRPGSSKVRDLGSCHPPPSSGAASSNNLQLRQPNLPPPPPPPSLSSLCRQLPANDSRVRASSMSVGAGALPRRAAKLETFGFLVRMSPA